MRTQMIWTFLAVVWLTPFAAGATSTSSASISVFGTQSGTGCGISNQTGASSSAGVSLADGVAAPNPPCTHGFVPTGSYALDASASAGDWSAGAAASISATGDSIGLTDGLRAESGAGFSPLITVVVAGLAQFEPILVSFDYTFGGSCGTAGAYSCVGQFQLRASTTNILRLFAPGSGTTAAATIFNDNLTLIGGTVNTVVSGSGTGSASGSWGNTARIVGIHVFDATTLVEFDPSRLTITSDTGTLPMPVPEPTLALLCGVGLLAVRRMGSGHRA